MSNPTAATDPKLDLSTGRPAGVRARPGQLAGGVGRELHDLVVDPVTFWTYLETRSVLATGLIAGIFLVATASTGIWFGSLVDHHRKQVVIQASAVASFVFYAPWRWACTSQTPESEWRDAANPHALGVRGGADARRDRRQPARDRVAHPRHPAGAGGRCATVPTAWSARRPALSFLVTSVISGLLVALDGHALGARTGALLSVMAGSFLHVSRLTHPGPVIVSP